MNNKERIIRLASKKVPSEYKLTNMEKETLKDMSLENVFNYGFHVGSAMIMDEASENAKEEGIALKPTLK